MSERFFNCEFAFKCPMRWEDLQDTGEPGSRSCSKCQKNVYLAEDEDTLLRLIDRQQCVAFRKRTFVSKLDDGSDSDFLLGMILPPDTTQSIFDRTKLRNGATVVFSDLSPATFKGRFPGFTLNSGEPANDGAIYSIEENFLDKKKWNLYRFDFVDPDDKSFAVGSRVGDAWTVQRLYGELAKLDLFLLGHETIVLGLPYHIDPWGIE